jgi:hypothetical protein
MDSKKLVISEWYELELDAFSKSKSSVDFSIKKGK